MSKKLRRFIFISFVVLFFILSAVILPYAFGYNLNWSGMKLQKTGMFDIKTEPSGATIYLNGKPQIGLLGKLSGRQNQVKTPAKISNQTPGTYQVKLELEGYWPWEKQLTIRPNETTYLEDVYFFKKNSLQTMSLSPKALAVTESNNQKLVAALGTTDLYFFTWNKPTETTIVHLSPGSNHQLVWSPNDENIVVGDLLINVNTKTTTDLKTFGQAPIGQAVWAEKDLLYFQDNKGLKWLNLKSNEEGSVFENVIKVNGFTIKNGYLYYTSSEPKAYLNIRKLGENQDQTKIKLSDNGSYSFINTPDNDLIIKNNANNNAYLINPGMLWLKNYETQFIGPLTTERFVDKNHLIYANNFELFDWNKQSDKPKLLTRISYPILSIAWHKSNNYIIFATDHNLNTLELDDRDTHNITTLLELDNIMYPLINQAGDKIIFWSKIENVSAFYLLEI
jgi:hypothetical protein